MAKKIAIILGAGASHDLITPRQSNSIKNSDYRPPLTMDLFSLHKDLEKTLNFYMRAYTAIGVMKNRFGQEGITLEGLLRELKESKRRAKYSSTSKYRFIYNIFSEKSVSVIATIQ